MPTNIFRGDSQDIAQVNTVTVGGTAAAGQVYTVTINRKEVAYTAIGGDTNSTIASALQALLAASTIAEFLEVTWTVAAAVITATSALAGRPFTNTSSATGTGTLVTATTTNSAGHWHWDDADNWSAGTVPAAGEDVYIANTDTDIRYGIDQNTLALTSLSIDASYTGNIGLPRVNSSGYYEYRETWLKVRPGTLNIGRGVGSGSGQIKIDSGSAAAVTANIDGTGTPSDSNFKALMINGSHASNVLNVTQGSIGLAMINGDTANFPTIRVGAEGSPATDVDLYCGSGCSLTTINQVGGNVAVNSNVTTWTKYGGDSTNYGSATVGTLTQDGQATHYWQSTGTLTAGTFRGSSSSLDTSRDLRGRTATNLTFQGGAYLYDPAKTITFTNAISVDAASANAIFQRNGFGTGAFSLQRS